MFMSSFPHDAKEALTMLYLQNQDLSNKTPSEINTMYWEALYEFEILYNTSSLKHTSNLNDYYKTHKK